MPISYSWANTERTGLVMTCTGVWTCAEIMEKRDESNYLVESVHHPLALIIHLEEVENRIPQGELSTLGQLWRERPRHLEHVIVVGVHPVAKMFFNLFLRVYPQARTQLSLVNSLEEALRIVDRQTQPTVQTVH